MGSLADDQRKLMQQLLTSDEYSGLTPVNAGAGVRVAGPVSVAQYLSAAWNTQPNPADSVSTAGSVVAPGAGAAVCSIASGSLPAGTYDIEAEVFFSAGAPVAADEINVEIREGASSRRRIAMVRALNVRGEGRCRMVLDGATGISVNAIVAATAGVQYVAALTATRLT